MCHENLTVNFNREANLLIGKNGSGKSAVLTALILGLGCKANATNRSNSVKRESTICFEQTESKQKYVFPFYLFSFFNLYVNKLYLYVVII